MDNNFKRGQDPKKSLQIGPEYYRQKKLEAVRNQNFEEAANWYTKEKELQEKNEA